MTKMKTKTKSQKKSAATARISPIRTRRTTQIFKGKDAKVVSGTNMSDNYFLQSNLIDFVKMQNLSSFYQESLETYGGASPFVKLKKISGIDRMKTARITLKNEVTEKPVSVVSKTSRNSIVSTVTEKNLKKPKDVAKTSRNSTISTRARRSVAEKSVIKPKVVTKAIRNSIVSTDKWQKTTSETKLESTGTVKVEFENAEHMYAQLNSASSPSCRVLMPTLDGSLLDLSPPLQQRTRSQINNISTITSKSMRKQRHTMVQALNILYHSPLAETQIQASDNSQDLSVTKNKHKQHSPSPVKISRMSRKAVTSVKKKRSNPKRKVANLNFSFYADNESIPSTSSGSTFTSSNVETISEKHNALPVSLSVATRQNRARKRRTESPIKSPSNKKSLRRSLSCSPTTKNIVKFNSEFLSLDSLTNKRGTSPTEQSQKKLDSSLVDSAELRMSSPITDIEPQYGSWCTVL